MSIRFVFLVLFIFGTVFLNAGGTSKSDFVQNLPHGKINWTQNYIYVTGSGAPSLKAPNVAVARLGAERVAKMDAMRNLLESIKGIHISGTTTIKNSIETSMEIRSNIDGVIRGMEVVTTKYFSDGAVDVVVKVPLSTILMDMANSETVMNSLSGKEMISINKNSASTAKDILVVDVRGKKFIPALFPIMYNDQGKIIYSRKQVNEEEMKKHGMVFYLKNDLSKAKDLFKGASSTLVVKPASIKNQTDIIINPTDLDKIAKELKSDAFTKGRVVILF